MIKLVEFTIINTIPKIATYNDQVINNFATKKYNYHG